MKKLFVIVVACMVHTHGAHGMMEWGADMADAALNRLNKWVHPEEYVLGSQNAKLYQGLLDAINDKPISELRIARFPDKNNTLHQFDITLRKRVAEREGALITCLLDQSLEQDPCKTDNVKLSDMITVNRLIMPDLYLALAMKSLQEKGHMAFNSGSIIVDAYLYKIGSLSVEEQNLLKNKLLENYAPVSLEEKRNQAETLFLSLPEEEREKLLQRMGKKATPSTGKAINQKITTTSHKTSHHNTPTQSIQLGDPNKITLQKNPIVDTDNQKILSLGTSSPKKVTSSDNNQNQQENDVLGEFDIKASNGEVFVNNEHVEESAGEPWYQFKNEK